MQKFYNTELPRNLSGGSDTWDQPQASALLAEIFDRGVVKSSTFNYGIVSAVESSYLCNYSIEFSLPPSSVNLRFLDLPSYSQSSCPTLDFTNPLANGLKAFFSVKDNIDLVTGVLSTVSTDTIPGNGIAGNFSGTSQQRFPHHPNYAIVGPITVVALVDNRTFSNDSILISKQDNATFSCPYEICLGSLATDSFGSFNRAGAISKMVLVGTTTAIAPNTSNNVIIFTDSSDIVTAAAPRQMYVNGKNYPITTYQNGSGTAENNTDNGADVIIGRKYDGTKQLDGAIYYIALWNRVLTASEIKDITANPWGLLQGSQVVIPSSISGGSSVLSNLTELYNIRSFIQGDRSSTYNIRSATNTSLVESFNIRANALSSLAESYNIRSFTVSDKAGTYNVRALIQKDNASTYYVNTLVNSSASQVYNIRDLVQKSLAETYDIRDLLQKSLTETYNIRDLVQKSLAETYDIRDLSLSDITGNYFVKSLVQQSLVEAYNIRDLVNSSLSSTYDILSTLAFVISDKSALYNIQESINSSKACTYNIRVDINSSLAENYLVNSFVVSSNNSLYNIRSAEQASISLAYNIRSGTFSSLSANYDILNAAQVSSNFTVDYLIRSATVKDTTLSYYIRTATISDEGCTYSIRVNLTKDSFFDFNILSVINASTAQQYNVRNKVQSDKTLEYFILALQAVYKDINVLYNILQDVVPDAIIIYVKDNSSIDVTVQNSTGLDILTSTNQLNVVVYTKNS